MKYFFYIYLIVISTVSYSQEKKILIIDSSSNKPIPFCAIDFFNNDGTFSDENGLFVINIDKIKKVKVTHLSYEKLEILLLTTLDTIKLAQKTTNLKEIEINKTNQLKHLRIGNNNKSIISVVLNPKTEFIVFIKPDSKLLNPIINTIEIPLKMSNHFSLVKNDEFNTAVLKLNIYNKNRELLYSQIIKTPLDERINNYKSLKLDNTIHFNPEGIFFGIEMLGYVDKHDRLTSSKKQEMITLKFSESKEVNQTFYRNVFYKNGDWNLIEKNSNIFNINSNKNFNLGLLINVLYN